MMTCDTPGIWYITWRETVGWRAGKFIAFISVHATCCTCFCLSPPPVWFHCPYEYDRLFVSPYIYTRHQVPGTRYQVPGICFGLFVLQPQPLTKAQLCRKRSTEISRLKGKRVGLCEPSLYACIELTFSSVLRTRNRTWRAAAHPRLPAADIYRELRIASRI